MLGVAIIAKHADCIVGACRYGGQSASNGITEVYAVITKGAGTHRVLTRPSRRMMQAEHHTF